MSLTELDKDRILTLLTHQYQALRTEIVEHTRGQYVLSAALVAMLVTGLGAGFSLWQNTLLAAAIFNIAVPLVIIVGVLGLFVSGIQMLDIGVYIKTEIEDKINLIFGNDFTQWLEDKEIQELHANPNVTNKGYSRPHNIIGWETYLLTTTGRTTSPNKGLKSNVKSNIIAEGILGFLAFLGSIIFGELNIRTTTQTIGGHMKILLMWSPLPLFIIGFVAAILMYMTMPKVRNFPPIEIIQKTDE